MPIVNPVPAYDFNVFLMDARPESGPSFSTGDLVPLAIGVGKGVLFGSFSEVSGLNAEMETEEYREGGKNTGPHKFIKWGKYPNLVFKRGVTANADLWDWYDSILYKTSKPVRKDGVIVLNDRGTGASSLLGGPTSLGLPVVDRLPTAIWHFRGALPEKLQGPSLNAKTSEMAIETFELVHQGLRRITLASAPGSIGRVGAALGI